MRGLGKFFEEYDFSNVVKRPEKIQISKCDDYKYLTEYKFTVKELNLQSSRNSIYKSLKLH